MYKDAKFLPPGFKEAIINNLTTVALEEKGITPPKARSLDDIEEGGSTILALKPCEICGSIAVAKLTTADRKQYGLCRDMQMMPCMVVRIHLTFKKSKSRGRKDNTLGFAICINYFVVNRHQFVF